MVNVAICSVSNDAAKANLIADALQARGHAVEYDHTSSDDFWAGDTVLQKIKEAQAAVIVWSEASSASALFRSQATAARDRTQLIHVSVDGMTPLFPFDGVSAIDLSNWDGEAGNVKWRQCLQRLDRLSGTMPAQAARTSSAKLATPSAAFGDWVPSRLLKTSLALSVAFLAGAMTSGLVTNRSEQVPASQPLTSTSKHQAVATPLTSAEASQAAAVQPLPLQVHPEVLAHADVVSARAEVHATKALAAPAARTGKAASVRTAHTPKPTVKPPSKAAVPKQRAVPKIKYAYSENMRLFCERAGRATPECRTFRRYAPKARRGASRRA